MEARKVKQLVEVEEIVAAAGGGDAAAGVDKLLHEGGYFMVRKKNRMNQP